ncbi:hypothetical protein E4U40_006929 [Claviceps sp. LM458 group G5]|nr:hypothetical protein E4U40_006929 [Claviceps sp. LM458 group G5]
MNNAETASRPDFSPAGELKLVLRPRGHCEQVPPFQSGAHARLTEMLQSLLDFFDEIEEESREGFRDLGQGLDALGLKVTIVNRNFMARMNNSTVVHEDAQLTPFYSVLTGELIPNCPSTLRELNAMPAGDIEAILIELGEVAVLDREGDKRRQLATAFGVKTRARTRGRANEALSSTNSKSKLLVNRLHEILRRAQGALNPASVIGAVDPQVLEKPAIWSTPISDLGVKTPLLSLEYPSLYPSYRPSAMPITVKLGGEIPLYSTNLANLVWSSWLASKLEWTYRWNSL